MHRITLECGHGLTLSICYPEPGDLIYCTSCSEYSYVYPEKAYLMSIAYYDGWRSTPIRAHVVKGECTHADCTGGKFGEPYTKTGPWHTTRDRLEAHILSAHTPYQTVDIPIPPKAARDAPPPF